MPLVFDIIVMFAAGFLTPFFLFTGSIKVFRWHVHLPDFQLGFMRSYGLNGTIYSLIGFFELAGALGLMLQSNHVLGTLAATGLMFLSIGAFCVHLKFDGFQFGMPALITTALSAFVLCGNFGMLSGLPENFPLSLETLSFGFKFGNILPATVGALLAFIFSRLMLAMATTQMTREAIPEAA